MNQRLKSAIEFYCSMLPNANKSSNPNDDRRLHEISFYLFKANERLDENFFKQELRKNSHAELDILDDNQFNVFAENRITEIKRVKNIVESLSDVIFSGFS